MCILFWCGPEMKNGKTTFNELKRLGGKNCVALSVIWFKYVFMSLIKNKKKQTSLFPSPTSQMWVRTYTVLVCLIMRG